MYLCLVKSSLIAINFLIISCPNELQRFLPHLIGMHFARFSISSGILASFFPRRAHRERI